MKCLTTAVFLLSVSCAVTLHAQFLDITIPSGELPSDLATWQDNPNLMHITLDAADGIELKNAHIVFEVKEGSEQIFASTRNKSAEQPPITGKFKKKNFKFSDILGDSTIEADPSIQSPASAVGKLPAGFFGLCFYLVDSAGNTVKEISQGCTNFFVRDIDSPTLLAPANETTLSQRSPLSFSWSPARVIAQTIHYQLKLYPIYEGQTPAQAMAGSASFYTSDDIFSTTYLYPPDAPPLNSLPKAKGFVWIVTQMDQNGKTIGKNYGRSAPSVFYGNADGK